MKCLNKNNQIWITIFFLLFLSFSIWIISFYHVEEIKPMEEIIGEESIYNPVTYDQVEEIYQRIQDKCRGALIIYRKEIVTNLDDFCMEEGYQQKLIGYSYEENQLLLYVNVIKTFNQQLYDLDEIYLGSSDNLENLFDRGTTFIYHLVKNDDRYDLSVIERMKLNYVK